MWTITNHVYGQYMLYNHVYVIQSCIMITVMYHELRHELYYTGNTIIIYRIKAADLQMLKK